MANPLIKMLVGQKQILNGVELLDDPLQLPHVPSTLPLSWDSDDETVVEVMNANADRTFVEIIGLRAGTATITVTGGVNTASIDFTISSATPYSTDAMKVQDIGLPH